MEFKLKQPCSDCPFLKDPYFHLEKGRRKEIADSLQSDQTFICHKTINYDKDWTYEGDEEEVFTPAEHHQHCAGALAVMIKSKTLLNNFLYRLAIMAGIFDPNKVKLDAPVYESLEEFAKDER